MVTGHSRLPFSPRHILLDINHTTRVQYFALLVDFQALCPLTQPVVFAHSHDPYVVHRAFSDRRKAPGKCLVQLLHQSAELPTPAPPLGRNKYVQYCEYEYLVLVNVSTYFCIPNIILGIVPMIGIVLYFVLYFVLCFVRIIPQLL